MSLQFWKKSAPAPVTGTITVSKDSSGLLIMRISGLITPQAVSVAQANILALATPGAKLRGLIDAEEFQGWAKGFDGGMSEVEKMFSIDDITDRVAVVSEAKWHERLRNFLCVWMRQATIKFFELHERAAAMSWLREKGS